MWHTGGSLNTEFKLTVKLYFLDGTSGVYLVNTDASESSNTFYGLKLGVDEAVAENYRDILNGGANKQYNVLKTYNPKIDVGTGNAGEGTKGVIYLNGWGPFNMLCIDFFLKSFSINTKYRISIPAKIAPASRSVWMERGGKRRDSRVAIIRPKRGSASRVGMNSMTDAERYRLNPRKPHSVLTVMRYWFLAK